MKRGDPLKYWNWSGTTYLEMKAGIVPMGITIYYSISRRTFARLPASAVGTFEAERIDQRAVAEALAVSLAYMEGT